MKKVACWLLFPLLILSGFAQEGSQKMSAEQEEMMAAWMKIAAPGDHHKHLEHMAGAWTVSGKYRMGPDAPWTETNGKSKSELILGGRYLEQKFYGDSIMGMPPFEGRGLLGFDNNKKKYTSNWVDNMSTLNLAGEGTCDGTHKTITFTAPYDDPFTQTKKTSRTVLKVIDHDTHIMEMYESGPDGKEFQNMVLTYTRKKST